MSPVSALTIPSTGISSFEDLDAWEKQVARKETSITHATLTKLETRMLKKNPSQDYRQECVDHLVANGWWFSKGNHTKAGFGIEIDADWKDFADHWSRLLLDEYMRDGGPIATGAIVRLNMT